MLRALYTSATGMKAQEMLIDNTANNLANVNTTGFRRSHIDFADLIYHTVREPGAPVANGQVSPTGLQIGNGVRVVSTTKHFSPGTFQETGNRLDVAIEGDGFFKVTLPNGNGTRYTRAGNFKIDQTGQLVNADGYPLEPAVNLGQVDVTQVTIGFDGTVGVVLADGTSSQVGTMQLSTFPNPAGLSSEGSNLFAVTEASGAEVSGTPGTPGFGLLRQNFLESSNVEVVTELIALISAQRAYEINSRAIQAGDEMLSTSAAIVR